MHVVEGCWAKGWTSACCGGTEQISGESAGCTEMNSQVVNHTKRKANVIVSQYEYLKLKLSLTWL